jgi:ATP-dependent DNA ligase
VLDGEVCCLDQDGRSHFRRLLFRRDRPHFYAFDALSTDGRDVRPLPLRPRRSTSITWPNVGAISTGWACERELEGIVAKWAHGT